MSDLKQSIGLVKWYNMRDGYGFLRAVAGGHEETFFHLRALKMIGLSLAMPGQRFSYTVRIGANGRTYAADLQLLD